MGSSRGIPRPLSGNAGQLLAGTPPSASRILLSTDTEGRCRPRPGGCSGVGSPLAGRPYGGRSGLSTGGSIRLGEHERATGRSAARASTQPVTRIDRIRSGPDLVLIGRQRVRLPEAGHGDGAAVVAVAYQCPGTGIMSLGTASATREGQRFSLLGPEPYPQRGPWDQHNPAVRDAGDQRGQGDVHRGEFTRTQAPPDSIGCRLFRLGWPHQMSAGRVGIQP